MNVLYNRTLLNIRNIENLDESKMKESVRKCNYSLYIW